MDIENDSYDFEDLRSSARQIDKGITFLEKKLAKVSNLGLTFNPDETKAKAINVLKEYETTIIQMKENIQSCTRAEESVLKDSIDDIKNVNSFIMHLKCEINAIENRLKKKGNYQPYQEPIEQSNGDSDSQNLCGEDRVSKNVSENGDPYNEADNCLLTEKLENGLMNNDINSTDLSNISNGCSFVTPPKSSFKGLPNFELSSTKECHKYLDRSYDSVDLSNQPITKTHYIDDICKTPTDPGISLTSMKLLGKSNIKTKVYKADHMIYANSKFEN